MSDDELHELEKRIALSGRQKQDYLIKSTLYQKSVVVGNQVQFEKLKQTLNEIAVELKRIEQAEDATIDLLSPIRTAVEIINSFTQKTNKIRSAKSTPQFMQIYRFLLVGKRNKKLSYHHFIIKGKKNSKNPLNIRVFGF